MCGFPDAEGDLGGWVVLDGLEDPTTGCMFGVL